MALRVILEIVPFGDEDKSYEIGRLEIFNKGRVDDTDTCIYGVINLTSGEEGLFDKTISHERQKGAWALVRDILAAYPAIGELSKQS